MVEIVPPKGIDVRKEVEGARFLKSVGVDAINIPDSPRASARMSNQALSLLVQQEVGIEAILHYTCRDRNVLSMQSDLLGAAALGIHNLICITGDPPKMGNYPDATAVFDVDAIGLVNIVHNLNRGLDIGGNPLGTGTSFVIGVGANPGVPNIDEEIKRFEYKVEAGAECAVTQPVFDLQLLEAFLRRIEHCKIPVIAGIWPLVSVRNAEFMKNELRVSVPDSILERMAGAKTPKPPAKKESSSPARCWSPCGAGAGGPDQRAPGPIFVGGGRARGPGLLSRYDIRIGGGVTPLAKFEDCLLRLEKIVQELEKGEVPLEKSLTLFEEGMQLSATCRKELEEAEGKVEILLKQNGKLQAEAFEPPARKP